MLFSFTALEAFLYTISIRFIFSSEPACINLRLTNERFLLRYLFSILLLPAFIIQTFSKTFIVADYYAHKRIYEKCCVNKNDKKKNCHGKCQMMKKLKEEEQKEEQNPGSKTENKIDVLSTNTFFAIIIQPAPTEIPVLTMLVYTTGKSIDRSLDIFHPPQV